MRNDLAQTDYFVWCSTFDWGRQ